MALCHTLAAAGYAGPLASQHTSSSNHNAGLISNVQAQSSSSNIKQQLPGIQGLMPGQQQLQPQADDAMLAYMQRLEEHRKRCELSGRCAADSVTHVSCETAAGA
jgi:hypothetical protein